MENNQISIKPIAYTFGLYLGLVTIISLVVKYVTGLDQSWIISTVSTIATIVVLYYGIKTYKNQNNHFLSIKEAIKVGLGIALIGGLLGAIYAYVHYSFIQPEFIEAIREKAYLDMTTSNPNMTAEQLETGSKMMNIFTSPFFVGTMILLFTLFFGLIISLITGAIMKKDDPSIA